MWKRDKRICVGRKRENKKTDKCRKPHDRQVICIDKIIKRLVGFGGIILSSSKVNFLVTYFYSLSL